MGKKHRGKKKSNPNQVSIIIKGPQQSNNQDISNLLKSPLPAPPLPILPLPNHLIEIIDKEIQACVQREVQSMQNIGFHLFPLQEKIKQKVREAAYSLLKINLQSLAPLWVEYDKNSSEVDEKIYQYYLPQHSNDRLLNYCTIQKQFLSQDMLASQVILSLLKAKGFNRELELFFNLNTLLLNDFTKFTQFSFDDSFNLHEEERPEPFHQFVVASCMFFTCNLMANQLILIRSSTSPSEKAPFNQNTLSPAQQRSSSKASDHRTRVIRKFDDEGGLRQAIKARLKYVLTGLLLSATRIKIGHSETEIVPSSAIMIANDLMDEFLKLPFAAELFYPHQPPILGSPISAELDNSLFEHVRMDEITFEIIGLCTLLKAFKLEYLRTFTNENTDALKKQVYDALRFTADSLSGINPDDTHVQDFELQPEFGSFMLNLVMYLKAMTEGIAPELYKQKQKPFEDFFDRSLKKSEANKQSCPKIKTSQSKDLKELQHSLNLLQQQEKNMQELQNEKIRNYIHSHSELKIKQNTLETVHQSIQNNNTQYSKEAETHQRHLSTLIEKQKLLQQEINRYQEKINQTKQVTPSNHVLSQILRQQNTLLFQLTTHQEQLKQKQNELSTQNRKEKSAIKSEKKENLALVSTIKKTSGLNEQFKNHLNEGFRLK